MSELDKLIDAADKYADNYNGDDRENIKTDVINAFFAGSGYANEQLQKDKAELEKTITYGGKRTDELESINMELQKSNKVLVDVVEAAEGLMSDFEMFENYEEVVGAVELKEALERYTIANEQGVKGE